VAEASEVEPGTQNVACADQYIRSLMLGRPVQSAQGLLQLNEWVVNPDSKMSAYTDDLAASRTHSPLPLLKTATQQIMGGSVVHRLDDHVTTRGTLNNTRPM
jgi:hypothetical protein